jgi:hypothetical protein
VDSTDHVPVPMLSELSYAKLHEFFSGDTTDQHSHVIDPILTLDKGGVEQ